MGEGRRDVVAAMQADAEVAGFEAGQGGLGLAFLGQSALAQGHVHPHRLDDQPHHLGLHGVDCGVEDAHSITVAKTALIGDIQSGQAMAFPKLLPKFL